MSRRDGDSIDTFINDTLAALKGRSVWAIIGLFGCVFLVILLLGAIAFKYGS